MNLNALNALHVLRSSPIKAGPGFWRSFAPVLKGRNEPEREGTRRAAGTGEGVRRGCFPDWTRSDRHWGWNRAGPRSHHGDVDPGAPCRQGGVQTRSSRHLHRPARHVELVDRSTANDRQPPRAVAFIVHRSGSSGRRSGTPSAGSSSSILPTKSRPMAITSAAIQNGQRGAVTLRPLPGGDVTPPLEAAR